MSWKIKKLQPGEVWNVEAAYSHLTLCENLLRAVIIAT
jgi:hypothetical protein